MRNVCLIVTLAAAIAAPALAQQDIVDTAVGAGNFSTLVTAVKAAGLVETLKGEGPFTVFAPTDEAFKAVPPELLQSLLKPENKTTLQAVLTYHVVAGKVLSSDVLNIAEATTVQGEKAPIGLTIGGANIVATDIQCTNGVIHVIDQVILPPSVKAQLGAAPAPAPETGAIVIGDPRSMIKQAVMKGSDLYNDGDHCGCANLYTKTMADLVNHSDMERMPQMREHLMGVLKHAGNTHDDDARAWMLRRGLDAAFTQVAN